MFSVVFFLVMSNLHKLRMLCTQTLEMANSDYRSWTGKNAKGISYFGFALQCAMTEEKIEYRFFVCDMEFLCAIMCIHIHTKHRYTRYVSPIMRMNVGQVNFLFCAFFAYMHE